MTPKENIDELKFIIGRYDHFYDNVNNKANLYLTINLFILGSIIAGYSALFAEASAPDWVQYLLFVPTLAFNLLSFIFVLLAIRPFTKKHQTTESLIFYRDVCNQEDQSLQQKWNDFSVTDWQCDLQMQAKVLADGLRAKFENLNIATFFIGAQVLLIAVFALYLFTI